MAAHTNICMSAVRKTFIFCWRKIIFYYKKKELLRSERFIENTGYLAFNMETQALLVWAGNQENFLNKFTGR